MSYITSKDRQKVATLRDGNRSVDMNTMHNEQPNKLWKIIFPVDIQSTTATIVAQSDTITNKLPFNVAHMLFRLKNINWYNDSAPMNTSNPTSIY